MKSHVEGFSETMEEPGDELWTLIRGNMLGYAMFGEHVGDEQNS